MIFFLLFIINLKASDIKLLSGIFAFVLSKNKTFDDIEDNPLIKSVELIYNLTSSLDKLPRFVPKIDEILKHPYFWTDGLKLEFMFDIRQFLNQNNDDSKWMAPAINNTAKFFDNDWTMKLEPKIHKDLCNLFSDHDKEKITDLLIYIRNKWVNRSEWNSKMKIILGNSETTYFDYWNHSYPKLFLHLFTCIQELHREKEPFDKFFIQKPVSKLTKEKIVLESPHFRDGFMYPRLRVKVSKKKITEIIPSNEKKK